MINSKMNFLLKQKNNYLRRKGHAHSARWISKTPIETDIRKTGVADQTDLANCCARDLEVAIS